MRLLPFTLLAFLFALPLAAQTEIAEVVEIPTEISKAPYQVGDLVTEQGYYIERAEGEPQINLRIVENKLYLYWIDDNGLIAEPEHQAATVRFTGSVRGRAYHRLDRLLAGAGLGAPGIMVPPHLYNVILVFPAEEGGEPVSHSFRYTPAMDVEVDPTADSNS